MSTRDLASSFTLVGNVLLHPQNQKTKSQSWNGSYYGRDRIGKGKEKMFMSLT